MRKKIINIIGNILMLVSFIFIVNRIIGYNIDFKEFMTVQVINSMIIATVTYAIVIIFLAKLFQKLFKIQQISGGSLGRSIIYIYCKSNLYKYLPGNIFHYIGRNQIAVENKIPHNNVVLITIAETVFIVLGGIITSVIFAGYSAASWIAENYDTIKDGVFAFLIACLIVFILYKKSLKIREWFNNGIIFFKAVNHLEFLKFFISYTATFIINGVMFILILRSIGANINGNLMFPVIGMYAFSWIIGFLTPGAPAGLGIRETIMFALLYTTVNEELVIAAAILYRFVSIFGDVLAFIIAFILKGILK